MAIRLRGLLLVLSAALSLTAAAQPFEAVLAGDTVRGCYILPMIDRGLVWVNPDRAEDSTDIGAVDSADGQRVFAVVESAPYRVVRIFPDGSRTSIYTGTGVGLQLAVAADGRFYVVANSAGSLRIDRISASGALEASLPLPVLPSVGGAFELAPDGCTIFYARGDTIARVNGCTGAALPDFATTASWANDIEVLPDGNVLIAVDGQVRQFSAAGVFVRTVANVTTYGFDSTHSIFQTVARDGILWIAVMDSCNTDESYLLRVQLSDGAEISRIPLELLNRAYSLVIGSATVAAIPTLSELVLVLLTLALGAAGALAIRLR